MWPCSAKCCLINNIYISRKNVHSIVINIISIPKPMKTISFGEQRQGLAQRTRRYIQIELHKALHHSGKLELNRCGQAADQPEDTSQDSLLHFPEQKKGNI